MWNRGRVAALAVGIGASALIAGSGGAGRHSAAGATRLANVGGAPVAFERNAGQANAGVAYVARAGRSALYLMHSRLVLALRTGHATDTLSIRFAHASPLHVSHGPRVSGVTNYLIGPDRRHWLRQVARFAAVRYARLYPGIDLDVHGGRAAQFEYDFHVAPGSDPGRIRLVLHGARTTRIARDGALVVQLRHGTVRQPRPRAWQTLGGVRVPVGVRYALAGDCANVA